jgi:hypothetical protein
MDNVIIVGGTNSFFCLWLMNRQNHRLTPVEVELGTVVRNITCVLPITVSVMIVQN